MVAREPKERVGVWDAKMNFCVVHRAEWITKRTNDQKKTNREERRAREVQTNVRSFLCFLHRFLLCASTGSRREGKRKEVKKPKREKKNTQNDNDEGNDDTGHS